MDHALQSPAPSTGLPRVRQVDITRPLVWLRQGWNDLSRARGASLGYGAIVAGFGIALLLVAWQATYLVPALVGGFLLVAPCAAIVLYALSEQIERGEPVDTAAAYFAWRRNAGSIALFGLFLALTLIFWERIAAILFALTYGGDVPDLSRLMADVLFSGRYLGLVVAFMVAGAVIAGAVFALSVVSAPLLHHRPVDVITAMLTSLRCCTRNPGAMLLWAALIAGITALGFATAMVGLVIAFPWLGHASWHAYRDLVADD